MSGAVADMSVYLGIYVLLTSTKNLADIVEADLSL